MSAPAAGPLSLRLLRALEVRLNRISTANDFNHDVDTVTIGKVGFAEGQTPAIALWIEEENPASDSNGGSSTFNNAITVIVEGHVLFDDSKGNGVELEQLKADIKRALFEAIDGAEKQSRGQAVDYFTGPPAVVTGFDISFGGARMAPRDDTASTDAVQVTVIARTPERTGDPYRQG